MHSPLLTAAACGQTLARADAEGGEVAGFTQVLIARQERASPVTLCGFLLDVYCLGVKDPVGPQVMGEGSLDAYVRDYCRAFGHPLLRIGLEQAQSIVHGGVAYTHSLGFEPAPDFAQVSVHLGELCPAALRIDFGRQRKPFYARRDHQEARRNREKPAQLNHFFGCRQPEPNAPRTCLGISRAR
ncbi:hypothetical protein ACIHCQ_00770 [Streptomyces sp. NPDC052236]|uniref:hypothetical protein n=1 Tax=Streptomyces sp. NPDC052236 TaxID=3365686 RepID=UPI0037CD6EC7